MKTKIKPELYEFLRLIEDNFDHIRDHLLSTYGDPRNDVGDAGNAIELIQNLVTEANIYEKVDFVEELRESLPNKFPSFYDIFGLLHNLELIIVQYDQDKMESPEMPEHEHQYIHLWICLGYEKPTCYPNQ